MGLAAPQIGLNLRLMVFNVEGRRGRGEELVLANPRIVTTSGAEWERVESCLSFKTGGRLVQGHVRVRPALEHLEPMWLLCRCCS
jgi:peptide deformylase